MVCPPLYTMAQPGHPFIACSSVHKYNHWIHDSHLFTISSLSCAMGVDRLTIFFFHFKNTFKMYLILSSWWISSARTSQTLCLVVDRPYLPITFLLQEDKLLLYKKVKFIGMVCLPTIHRCLKSVHRLPESNKLLTWIKRILPFKAYSTLHTNKPVQQQGGSYNKHNFHFQNFIKKNV